MKGLYTLDYLKETIEDLNHDHVITEIDFVESDESLEVNFTMVLTRRPSESDDPIQNFNEAMKTFRDLI